VEASALRAPALARRPLATPLLRLRSDEQLIALFRAGSEEAFATIHDRYRQRLFAYVRQMLSKGPRADAEDVLQDVFMRAYGALRANEREVNLRAWLYRVAHNRCIDHLRRPTPPAGDVFEMSRRPLQDPIEMAQRREDLRRLVDDVGRLPEQQRSALLMREIDGLAYVDISAALDVTVPAVKSLLVRARMGLVEAIESREADCSLIRVDLLDAYDRGVKASGRARRHMRECDGCREYRGALRGMRRSFAALTPAAGFGPVALLAKALGAGSAGSGGAAAGVGGAGALGGTAIVGKVAVVVCGAALATGGAVEVRHLTKHQAPRSTEPAAASAAVPVVPAVAHPSVDRLAAAPAAAQHERARHDRSKASAEEQSQLTQLEVAPPVTVDTSPATETAKPETGNGGSAAPKEEDATTPAADKDQLAEDAGATFDPGAPAEPEAGTPPEASGPPPEH
jgi:RNA polymerase sigma factor (sigma-70 family)